MAMLKYPLTLNENDTDYVTFSHRKYRPNRVPGGASGEVLGAAPPNTSNRITLYMPNSTPVSNYGNAWNNQNFAGPLGDLRRNAATTLGKGLDDLTSVKGIDDVKEAVKKLGSNSGKTVADAIDNTPGIAKQIGAEIIGRALVGSGNNLLALTTGKIYNPNVELLYQGPQLRQFSFDFLFVPRSQLEADMVSMIIKEFKVWSAPGDPGEEGYLCVPDVWDISYGGKVVGKMNKFKPCALTSISVQDNAGETLHTTFTDGTPTSTSIKMTFSEVDILTRKDHEEAGGRGF